MDHTRDSYFDSFHQTAHGELKNTYYNPFMVKHRRRTSKMQLRVLEKTFETNVRPDAALRKVLGEQLGMNSRSVQVWFQNRRAKIKKGRRPDENRRDSLSQEYDESCNAKLYKKIGHVNQNYTSRGNYQNDPSINAQNIDQISTDNNSEENELSKFEKNSFENNQIANNFINEEYYNQRQNIACFAKSNSYFLDNYTEPLNDTLKIIEDEIDSPNHHKNLFEDGNSIHLYNNFNESYDINTEVNDNLLYLSKKFVPSTESINFNTQYNNDDINQYEYINTNENYQSQNNYNLINDLYSIENHLNINTDYLNSQEFVHDDNINFVYDNFNEQNNINFNSTDFYPYNSPLNSNKYQNSNSFENISNDNNEPLDKTRQRCDDIDNYNPYMDLL